MSIEVEILHSSAEARRELVAAAAQLSELGLSPGSSGNVSARDGDVIVMTPTGSDLGDLDPDELSILGMDGVPLAGPKVSKEFPLHRSMYLRNPEHRAVVHLHSSNGAAVSCLEPWSAESAIPPLTPYFVMRVGQVPLIPYAEPGDASQAEAIGALGLPFRAVLLQNHGIVVAGTSMATAVESAIELEEVCKLFLLMGSRPAHLLSDDEVARLATRYASPWTHRT
jgi:ribulose-5-phosphate 4-epimerase/fuculose-1-phosphate aldolase